MKKLIALTLIASLLAGCTHSVKITKGPEAAVLPGQPVQDVAVGFTPVGHEPLLEAAVDEMQASPAIREAIDNYKFGGKTEVDYVCQLRRETKFKASGQNFFITFPGFLVFTHALVGYKYKANITTESTLLDPQSNQVSQVTIETPYQFRHCSFARGSAASLCGWVAPGYGALAIVPGAIFAFSYDKRATDEFENKVRPLYARYVSSRIVEQVGAAQAEVQPPQPEPAYPTEQPEELPPVTQIGPESNEPASETEYAVYVMRINGNEISEPEVHVQSVPAGSRTAMALMSQSLLVPNEDTMSQLLGDLGISPGDYFGGISEVQVHTQIDEEIVALQKISSEPAPVL